MLKSVLAWFEKHHDVSLIITLIIASIIFYLSSIPSVYYPQDLGILTKIYHVLIFFVLSLFLLFAIIRGKINHKYYVFVAILLALLFATTDEIHQSFVPGRTPALTDVLIDSIGILSAGIIYSIRLKWKRLFIR